VTETSPVPDNGQKARAVRKQPGNAPGRDRRVSRTRHALHRALFSLLEERPYEALTVVDICERADIGRSAFYEHFAGKDIAAYGALKQSLMPDGLEAGMSVADFRDLLAYLESLK
jgi:AcrR family transcriptional regulator